MSFAVIADFSSNFVCSSIYQNRRSPYGRYSKQPKTPQKNYPNEKKKKQPKHTNNCDEPKLALNMR